MFNPFAPFDQRYLPEFRKKGVKAFVKQAYPRGINLLEELPRPAYLLCHYDDIGLAQEHYDSIKHDPDRQLFILNDARDLEELQNRLRVKDALYYTRLVVKDANHKAQQYLDKQLRAYIDNRTNWNPARYDEVGFSLDSIFGQIYAELTYKGRKEKIKLDQLESMMTVIITDIQKSSLN